MLQSLEQPILMERFSSTSPVDIISELFDLGQPVVRCCEEAGLPALQHGSKLREINSLQIQPTFFRISVKSLRALRAWLLQARRLRLPSCEGEVDIGDSGFAEHVSAGRN